MVTRIFIFASLALALAACAPEAQQGPGAVAAHARHEHFEALGKAFKTISTEAKKTTPDLAALQSSAAEIDTLAQALPSWFPAGSGPADGVKTHAKAEIWTNPAAFAATAQALQAETAKLHAAADVAAIQAGIAAAGAKCGACHKEFRAKGL